MSYTVYGLDALDPLGWSQAVWKIEGRTLDLEDCSQELIHDVLLRHLPRDGLIVDAGCGSGKWPIYLRRRGYRAFGIDISHDACVIARENDPGVPLLRADSRHSPIRNAALDVVLSSGVVEHDQDGPLSALRELRRILRPGGTLILAVPYDNPFRRVITNPLLSLVTRYRRRKGWKLGFMEYRFNLGEVRDWLRQSGFEEVAVHCNDYLAPKNMGLWVDYQNLFFDPIRPIEARELFVLPAMLRSVGLYVAGRFPWLVCGEIVFVARAT